MAERWCHLPGCDVVVTRSDSKFCSPEHRKRKRQAERQAVTAVSAPTANTVTRKKEASGSDRSVAVAVATAVRRHLRRSSISIRGLRLQRRGRAAERQFYRGASAAAITAVVVAAGGVVAVTTTGDDAPTAQPRPPAEADARRETPRAPQWVSANRVRLAAIERELQALDRAERIWTSSQVEAHTAAVPEAVRRLRARQHALAQEAAALRAELATWHAMQERRQAVRSIEHRMASISEVLREANTGSKTATHSSAELRRHQAMLRQQHTTLEKALDRSRSAVRAAATSPVSPPAVPTHTITANVVEAATTPAPGPQTPQPDTLAQAPATIGRHSDRDNESRQDTATGAPPRTAQNERDDNTQGSDEDRDTDAPGSLNDAVNEVVEATPVEIPGDVADTVNGIVDGDSGGQQDDRSNDSGDLVAQTDAVPVDQPHQVAAAAGDVVGAAPVDVSDEVVNAVKGISGADGDGQQDSTNDDPGDQSDAVPVDLPDALADRVPDVIGGDGDNNANDQSDSAPVDDDSAADPGTHDDGQDESKDNVVPQPRPALPDTGDGSAADQADERDEATGNISADGSGDEVAPLPQSGEDSDQGEDQDGGSDPAQSSPREAIERRIREGIQDFMDSPRGQKLLDYLQSPQAQRDAERLREIVERLR